MNCKILIVEDEGKLREVLCDYFSSKGETPFEARDGLQALELLEENEFDAVLLGYYDAGAGWAFCVPGRKKDK